MIRQANTQFVEKLPTQTTLAPPPATVQDELWTSDPNKPPGFSFKKHPGLQIPAESLKQSIDFVNLFITQNLINTMLIETNSNAETKINKQKPLEVLAYTSGKEVSCQEIKYFLTVMLHMGHVNMPTIEHYYLQDILHKYPFW